MRILYVYTYIHVDTCTMYNTYTCIYTYMYLEDGLVAMVIQGEELAGLSGVVQHGVRGVPQRADNVQDLVVLVGTWTDRKPKQVYIPVCEDIFEDDG